MRIGLVDIEPKIINTVYMQIAKYHRQRGDVVEWWSPLTDSLFDKVYCSSLFDFTGKNEVPSRSIIGGTGFDVKSQLSKEIEQCDCDYSIYPECDFSIVWFSRGCIRKCPFCLVSKKEGGIRSVEPKALNPNGKYIVVQDNNFFANPQWAKSINQLIDWGQPVDFQGVDARILNKEMCRSLLRLKHRKKIKIAWDNPLENLLPKLQEITQYIKPCRMMCYVLIGFWSTPGDDMRRVIALDNLGIDPFVMAFNKSDPYQKSFARWVNHKAVFKTVKWENYKGNLK